MRRVTSVLANLVLLLVPGLLAPATVSAQIRIVAAAQESSPEVTAILQRGEKLETENRWGEALSLYEEAIRARDGQPAEALTSRHFQAKIHYDLARRYNDASFLRTVTTLEEREALNLYSEVLLKIQSHYVTEPNWKSLIDRGISTVDVAMHQERFSQQHLRGKSAGQVTALLEALHTQLVGRSIRTRQEAIDAVTLAGRLSKQQLGLPPAAVILEFACGATGALDEYSAYLTSDQLNEVYSQIEGNFVGLGIELKANDGALQIVKVITGSPAEQGGLKAGDRIIAVDKKSTVELSTDEAANMLQGQEGTTVELTLLSPNQSARRVKIRRQHVEVPSVDEVKIVDQQQGVGYCKITCFQKTTSKDLDVALWKLHREGMKSLIIDLRGNPGGLLTASVDVVDKFVQDGVIVSTRGRSSQEDYSYTAHKVGTWQVPLVVLIDGDSASASEIFAGAIRDHRRGTIVGQRSYGKGSVQGIFPLATANCGVRLTTAKFYSPSGRPISHVGVTPDIVVQQVAKPVADTTAAVEATDVPDAVLAAGLQVARKQLAKR